MKSTGLWLRQLAVAGSCLVWAGCGGGGVPDPSSDPLAATEQTPRANSQPSPPPEPEPTPEPTPAPVAVAVAPTPAPVSPTPPVEREREGPTTATVNPESPATAPVVEESPTTVANASDPAPSAAAGDSSGTEEMLRMGSAAGPAPAAAPAPGATSSATPPGGMPGPAVSSAPGESPAAPSGDRSMRGSEAAALGPTAPPRRSGDMMAAAPGGTPGSGVAGEGAASSGSGFGSGGESAGGAEDLGPEAFRNAGTAVNAFLNAVKAKNKDRLSQATARRAATEAVEKHRKIFAAILEQSVSDEELDDMARALEGFKVMGILPAKSTGQQGVVISKMEGRDRLQRTVQVRREKEGWKVMDLGGIIDFKPTGTYRRPFGKR